MLSGLIKSKTAWFGFLVSIVGFFQAQTDFFKAVLPEKYYGYFVSALGVAVIALRLVTTESIADKASSGE